MDIKYSLITRQTGQISDWIHNSNPKTAVYNLLELQILISWEAGIILYLSNTRLHRKLDPLSMTGLIFIVDRC